MNKEYKGSASGLIVVPPQPSDYQLGGFTGIVPAIRVSDWRQYLPDPEPQYGDNFDTMSCVSFSMVHAIEAQVNYLLSANQVTLSQRAILTEYGYLDSVLSNRCKLSARFLAISSGTTKNGNWVQKVAETARIVGCIPDKDLPFGGKTFEEYHNPKVITQEMRDKALLFLTIFKLQYEWVFYDLDPKFSDDNRKACDQAILQAPLVIGVPMSAQHAILMSELDDTKYTTLDQYPPYMFEHSYDYPISFAFRVVVNMQKPFTFETQLVFNMRHPDVAMLQKILNKDKDTIVALNGTGSKGNETVYFGKLTRDAVIKFQKKYGLSPIGEVGPKTRVCLNQILSGGTPQTSPAVLNKFSLKPIVLEKAKYLIDQCALINLPIKITQGYRDSATQQALYNQGRTTPGTIVTNAKPGYSFHNYGVAFDVCFTTGEPYKGRGADFKKVAEIATKVQLEWGGDWTSNLGDIPHFQFTGGYTIEQFVAGKVNWSVFGVK